jgi:NADPH:quinone reductase-like Zn-dependent oxidoreductase
VAQLTGGRGADLVLESFGGDTCGASLAAARRITGRVVVYGAAGGEATISNRELTFTRQEFMRRVARDRLGIEPDVMPGDHCPMLGHTKEVADRLEEYRAEVR